MSQIPDQSDSALTFWKKLNKQLVTKNVAAESAAELVGKQHNEALEKLALGLLLLREFKSVQDQVRGDGIFIAPLHANSSRDDCLRAIRQLAQQAAQDDYYADLQDACLLIEDALCELSPNDIDCHRDVLIALNDWSLLQLSELETIPTFETSDVTTVLANEVNATPVSTPSSEAEEKLTLGLQLLRECKATQSVGISIDALQVDSLIADYSQAIQQLTQQALLNENCTELQDACFLLEDALCELSATEFDTLKVDLLFALNEWIVLPVLDMAETFDDFNLAAAVENATDANATSVSTPSSEAEEKLTLGLQLLRECKATQSVGISIDALQVDSLIADYSQAIQQLTQQALLNENCTELQDACFLLEDALCELSATEFDILKVDLLSALNDWMLSEPEAIAVEISEDELPLNHETLETTACPPAISSHDDYIVRLEAIANQADKDGYSGLCSVNLLMIEAVHELAKDANIETLLDSWCNACLAYQQHSLAAIDDIVHILQHSDFNMPLSEEDFATFITLLVEEIGTDDVDVVEIEVVEQPVLDVTVTSAIIDEVPVSVSSVTLEENEVAEPATIDITVTPTIIDEAPVSALAVTIEENQVAEPPLSAMAQELVELLDTEAGLLNYRFLAISFDEPISARAEHFELASEELSRLANASTMIGFTGLSEVCNHVNANITHFASDVEGFTEEKRNLLLDWVSGVKAYLTAFGKQGAGQAVLAQLTNPLWPQPLTAEASAVLAPQMRVTGLNDDTTEEQQHRETLATDENVSLALPDDVNKELLELLLQELPAYTQQFSEAIQRLQSGGTSKDIDVAQRIAHTIKGSANTVGIKGIAVLTHQMEDILMACAKAHKQPSAALLNTLINASDCLEAQCESLLGLGEPPQDAQAVLQEVLDWANQIAKQGIQDTDTQPIATVKPINVDNTVAPTDKAVTTPSKKEEKETAEATQVAMVRVPTEQIENLFKLSSESIILNGQIYERQRRLKNQLQAMEAQFALLQQLGAELEQLIDLKDLSGRSMVNTGKDFDALEMDQYNELHTASRRMVEASVDARELGVDMKKELEYMNEILEYQQRLVINTQEAVMQTRFIPVGSIALRLQRGLRQTCRLTGKQGELNLSGEELLIDGDTLSALVEPLMHLLRNAIDHGLETEDERILLGKSPVGQINIEFDREGNSILVRCRDDGRGLDFGAIRHTAEKRGDVQAGETVTEDQLKQLILRPNFSTRTQSTQTSGRGVGMDVVNFQVLSLGGSLSLNSIRGQGLTVELRMPLPLSRSHALLANAGPYKVAISSKGLTQILYSGAGEIKTISHERVLMVGEDIYPVVSLEALLHIQDRRKGERPLQGAVLLVQNENKMTAVLVDSITDSRDVVIKSLGYYMRKIHGFVGATILGDGSVTPVLDIPELLRTPVDMSIRTYGASMEKVESSVNHTKILVVDDSLSQRRALEQILTDAGFQVHTARDGIEAAEWLVHSKPAAVVTDLEMPRMNGLELASHIRSQATMKTLPIIMITSRSTEKHRLMAEESGIDFYLVKPVQDDNLLTKLQSLIDKQLTAAAA